MQKAYLAAGCFWGVEETFRNLEGIYTTRVGFAGGFLEKPTYQNVCTGTTGHAETIEVVFDPILVSYDELLDIFWDCHDPTQLNRQGPDIGSQYRSVIFYVTPDQREQAMESKKRLQSTNDYRRRKIVTEIKPIRKFWPAEEYHQQYLLKKGRSRCATGK